VIYYNLPMPLNPTEYFHDVFVILHITIFSVLLLARIMLSLDILIFPFENLWHYVGLNFTLSIK
jgi:hypothetical protein